MSEPIEIVAEPDPPGLEAVFDLFHGELAFDIGANVGQSARSLAPRFAAVVSCEPADESFELLLGVAEEFQNVDPLNVAIGATDGGSMTLTVQKNHIARGQLTAYRAEVEDGHAWGEVIGHREVPMTSIDFLAAKYGRPDFIKVDVEGSEVEVIKGGLETIEVAQPRLYIEVHNAPLGEALDGMLRPIYGDDLGVIRHPNYAEGTWGRENHYWLVVT
jgi:FkbM family methyltransferase